MATIGSLGASGAVTDTLREMRAQAQDRRAAASHQQRLEMNKQLMETNEMKNQAMRNQLLQQRKEMQRRDQVLPLEEVLKGMPTGPDSANARMLVNELTQSGATNGRTVKVGPLEDVRKRMQNDPNMSMRLANNTVEHWKNASKRLEAEINNPESKMNDKQKEEAAGQLQEYKKRWYAAENSNEKLGKVLQRRQQLNTEVEKNMHPYTREELRKLTGGRQIQYHPAAITKEDKRMIKMATMRAEARMRREAEEKRYGGMSPQQKQIAKLEDRIKAVKAQRNSLRARQNIFSEDLAPQAEAQARIMDDEIKVMEEELKRMGGRVERTGTRQGQKPPKETPAGKGAGLGGDVGTDYSNLWMGEPGA